MVQDYRGDYRSRVVSCLVLVWSADGISVRLVIPGVLGPCSSEIKQFLKFTVSPYFRLQQLIEQASIVMDMCASQKRFLIPPQDLPYFFQ